jgi:hypothetical protein
LAIAGFAEAGFDRVSIHQVGRDQEGVMRFYEREVFPQVDRFRALSRGKPLAA